MPSPSCRPPERSARTPVNHGPTTWPSANTVVSRAIAAVVSSGRTASRPAAVTALALALAAPLAWIGALIPVAICWFGWRRAMFGLADGADEPLRAGRLRVARAS